MNRPPRVTLIHIEVDVSWASLVWGIAIAAGSVGAALWWTG